MARTADWLGETFGFDRLPRVGRGGLAMVLSRSTPVSHPMEEFFVSAGLVAIAEIGDKTQLLALVLAARFRQPLPIVAGILLATLANHALAASAGMLVANWLGPDLTRWILGLSFLAMAAWTLVPDEIGGAEDAATSRRFGAFVTTLVAFFLLEMGDKTQITTIALAARFDSLVLVTAGTTAGMMLANVPAVFLGDAASRTVPLRLVRLVAAAAFTILGLLVLLRSVTLM